MASASRAAARRDGSNGRPIAVVLGLVPAGPDRDVEPAPGEDVEAREVLGEDRRVPQVVVQDERRRSAASSVAAAIVAMASDG